MFDRSDLGYVGPGHALLLLLRDSSNAQVWLAVQLAACCCLLLFVRSAKC